MTLVFKEQRGPVAWAACRSWLDTQTLHLAPDPLNQHLCFHKVPRGVLLDLREPCSRLQLPSCQTPSPQMALARSPPPPRLPPTPSPLTFQSLTPLGSPPTSLMLPTLFLLRPPTPQGAGLSPVPLTPRSPPWWFQSIHDFGPHGSVHRKPDVQTSLSPEHEPLGLFTPPASLPNIPHRDPMKFKTALALSLKENDALGPG